MLVGCDLSEQGRKSCYRKRGEQRDAAEYRLNSQCRIKYSAAFLEIVSSDSYAHVLGYCGGEAQIKQAVIPDEQGGQRPKSIKACLPDDAQRTASIRRSISLMRLGLGPEGRSLKPAYELPRQVL